MKTLILFAKLTSSNDAGVSPLAIWSVTTPLRSARRSGRRQRRPAG